MHLLNPIWLFTAAAIIIPVVVHLWNIRPGKVLKVGSTLLVQAASRRSSRSFKLLDVLLLILRCLLLVLLTMLLALPVLQQRIMAAKVKGWVMLPKEQFSETYRYYKTSIDSLTSAGYEFHFFNTGFPKAGLSRLLAGRKDLKTIDTVLSMPSAYWSLLQQLDNQVPSSRKVYLFTTNTSDHFNSARPEIGFNLNWKTYTPADSVSNWIQGAWFTANNTIRVVKGTSKPSGTRYQYDNIGVNRGNSQFNVNVTGGIPVVSLNDFKSSVKVDTSTQTIAIYTDRYQADADYLKAALDAVAQFTQRKTTVKQYTNANTIPKGQSWVFWLSDQPYPARLSQATTSIVAYQAGKPQNVSSWINAVDNFSLPDGTEQVSLFKEIRAKTAGKIIWKDGFGNPILSMEDKAGIYRLYTHFNPTWNDLVWNNSFPRLILQLVNPKNDADSAGHNRIVMPAAQIQPAKIVENHTLTDRFIVTKNLGLYFWLALVVVFFTERWLATKHKQLPTNG